MLEWDSDDDSLGDMTRVSDALGEAHDEAKHGEEDEIDEMELLQLRNLVQQIKLQTVLGDKFVKLENQGTGTNCLASIVTPVTEEDMEAKYRQLQADHVDVVEERDQLAARINQLTMQGEGGQRSQGVHNNTEIIAKIERERDEARRETQAAKEEVENLKISQINLKLYYQQKANQLGTGSMKNGSKDCSSFVPLEEYNRLKEVHFSLNKQLAESEHNVYQQQDDLHEAIRRAQQAENQLGQIKYQQMWKEQAQANGYSSNNQANGYSSNNQAGLLGNPVLHQILQMNQQLQHNNYRR